MSPALDLLRKSLARRDLVTLEEMALLGSLGSRTVQFPKGAELVAEQHRPTWSCLLQSGLAGRAIARPNGTRQLTALHVPGDFVDLHAFLLKSMDHSVVALSACVAVFFPHDGLRQITEKAPHLTRLLWLLTTIDAAIQRRMTALVGRYTPMERLGHLLCEIYVRLETVGLAGDGKFQFPITQAELSDILGLSLVHTNRTVQDLRATNLVTWDQHKVSIPDFSKLAGFSGFDPAYLNLNFEPR